MTNSSKNRIIWQSRRGMLELDLLLEPFARNIFEQLSIVAQREYQDFLNHEDQDLYAWLVQGKDSGKTSYDLLIRQILENSKKLS